MDGQIKNVVGAIVGTVALLAVGAVSTTLGLAWPVAVVLLGALALLTFCAAIYFAFFNVDVAARRWWAFGALTLGILLSGLAALDWFHEPSKLKLTMNLEGKANKDGLAFHVTVENSSFNRVQILRTRQIVPGKSNQSYNSVEERPLDKGDKMSIPGGRLNAMSVQDKLELTIVYVGVNGVKRTLTAYFEAPASDSASVDPTRTKDEETPNALTEKTEYDEIADMFKQPYYVQVLGIREKHDSRWNFTNYTANNRTITFDPEGKNLQFSSVQFGKQNVITLHFAEAANHVISFAWDDKAGIVAAFVDGVGTARDVYGRTRPWSPPKQPPPTG